MAAPKRRETNSRWRFGGETCTSGRIEVVLHCTLRCSRGCCRFQGEATGRKQQAQPQDPHYTRVTHSTDSRDALRLTTDYLPRARPAAWRTLPQTHLEFLFYFLRSFCRRTPPLFTRVPHHAEARGFRSLLALFNQDQLCCREEEVLMGKGRPGNYTTIQQFRSGLMISDQYS